MGITLWFCGPSLANNHGRQLGLEQRLKAGKAETLRKASLRTVLKTNQVVRNEAHRTAHGFAGRGTCSSGFGGHCGGRHTQIACLVFIASPCLLRAGVLPSDAPLIEEAELALDRRFRAARALHS